MTATQELIKEIGLLSYVGIWFLSIVSNVVIPVPEEVIVIILGYLSAGPKLNTYILLPVVISGFLVSDIAMYFFSKKGNKLITAFYNKVFASRLDSRKEWIEKHINKVVFFSRFLIQLRFLGPFFAGQTGMSFRKFFTLDFLALVIYVPFYLLIGRYFRGRINFIINGVNAIRNIIIMVALLALLFALIRYIRRRLLKTK